jgi:hypothetical protein
MKSFGFASRLGLAVVPLVAALACSDQQPTLPDIRAAAGGGSGGVSVTATVPDSATQDTTLDVVVSGSGFDQGSQAQWAIAGVPSAKVHTNSTQFVTSKKLIANITIAIDADTGLYDVMVTASTGKKGIGSELFAIRQKGGQQAPDPEIAMSWNGEIWVMNADGTRLFMVADQNWAYGLAASSWAPGGNGTVASPYRLAFEADASRSLANWPLGIVEVDTVGGSVNARNHRVLSTSEPAVHFAWSPLADSIVVADGAPEGAPPSDLHLIAPDGTGEHTIYSAPDSDWVRYPAWSAEGRYIAFVEQPGGGSSRYTTRGDAIKVLNLTTRAVTLVLQLPPNTIVSGLDWARTRNAVAYATAPYASCPPPRKNCPVYGLYVLELDASLHPLGSPSLITSVGGSPSWASDDKALVFSDGTVHRYDFATGRITNLASGNRPDWRR